MFPARNDTWSILYCPGNERHHKYRERLIPQATLRDQERPAHRYDRNTRPHTHDHLSIYKRPLEAHRLRFRIPEDSKVIMGHTRMTTQGKASRNRNNHPFLGSAAGEMFALAHNGMLYNDRLLRRTNRLPKTKIETDSYVAVQLIEQKKALDFSSLKYMAEQVEGTFTFTVLDQQENLYFVKGDNPLCLYHYPRYGVYLYASTEAILTRALNLLRLPLGKPERIELNCGDILEITASGQRTTASFNASHLAHHWGYKRNKRILKAGGEEAFQWFEQGMKAMHGFADDKTTCAWRKIEKYFGEKPSKRCRVCSNCIAKKLIG